MGLAALGVRMRCRCQTAALTLACGVCSHFGETFNRPVQTDHVRLGIVPPLFASAAVGNEAGITRETA